jgi:hypothetical protein
MTTALVLGALQACSTSSPHTAGLPDCLDPTCTIATNTAKPPSDASDVMAQPDTSVADTSVPDSADASGQ